MVIALGIDLLLELEVIYSEGLNAFSESVDGVSELLGREFGVRLRSWLRCSGSSLRRDRRRGLRCHFVES